MIICRYIPFLIIAIVFSTSASPAAAMDDPLRCASDIITLGDTMYEVRAACGQPFSTQIVGETKKYRILKKKRYRIESTAYLSEWIYESDDGIYVLTFEGSRVVEKEFIFQ